MSSDAPANEVLDWFQAGIAAAGAIPDDDNGKLSDSRLIVILLTTMCESLKRIELRQLGEQP